MKFILKFYFSIYDVISVQRLKSKDIDPKVIHNHLTVTLATSILMWTYTVSAFFFSSEFILFKIGLICSFIHLFSPALFLVSSNSFFITSLMLGVGMFFQSSYAYYDGGYYSNILVWMSVHPLLAGVILGKRGALIWGFIGLSNTVLFLVLDILNYKWPSTVSTTGQTFNHSLLFFGYICLSTLSIYIYMILKENNDSIISSKTRKINNLLRVVLHDISNPLTIVLGQNRRLKTLSQGLEKEEREKLEIISKRINTTGTTIKEIIEDIRGLYIIEDGKIRVKSQECDMNELIEDSLLIFSEHIKNKNIYIDFKKDKALPLISIDSSLFKNQILSNILSNAIKFSSEDSIIQIQTNFSEGRTYITIRDFGIGMPEELKKSLFEEGTVTSRKGTGGEQGTGYGMIIVKSYLEAFNGKINVKSQEQDTPEFKRGTQISIEI